MSPLVTIILPTFERATYLREAIDSALAQTYGDFVLSIGDNSRNDATEQVVREYDDPRIVYRRHPENLGQQGNWLWLIENATTPYVASLHDDDAWTPEFLERTVPVIDADPTISMVFSDYDLIDGEGRLIPDETAALTASSHRDRLPAGRLDLDLPEALRLVAVWNAPQPAYCAVLRRSAVVATEFPAAIDPVYDIWLSYQIARRGERFAFVPGKLTRYRWHPGSSTTTGWSAPEDEIFSRIICENAGAGDVIHEIQEYWASIRWGRATRMMASTEMRVPSRIEFKAASPHLPLHKKLVSSMAAQSDLAWDALRMVRSVAHKVAREDR
ncbi:MAG: glycosyltransferase family 2 protein [Acidimicrobiales bacterium]